MNTDGWNRLGWSGEVWNALDQAVHDEHQRTQVAARFLPMYGPLPPDTLTVPAQVVIPPKPDTTTAAAPGSPPATTLTIDEGETSALQEIWVDFALTSQQLSGEGSMGTGLALATRAASLLAQAADLLIFQGQDAATNPLFQRVRTRSRANGFGRGLLSKSDLRPEQIVEVKPVTPRSSSHPGGRRMRLPRWPRRSPGCRTGSVATARTPRCFPPPSTPTRTRRCRTPWSAQLSRSRR